MVELVVWEMGDVGDDYVKNATLAFIRQVRRVIVIRTEIHSSSIFLELIENMSK